MIRRQLRSCWEERWEGKEAGACGYPIYTVKLGHMVVPPTPLNTLEAIGSEEKPLCLTTYGHFRVPVRISGIQSRRGPKPLSLDFLDKIKIHLCGLP